MKDIRKHAETMADTVTPIIRGVLTEHWQAALEEIRDHQTGEVYKNRLIKAVKAEKMDEPIENYFLDIIDSVYKVEKPRRSRAFRG